MRKELYACRSNRIEIISLWLRFNQMVIRTLLDAMAIGTGMQIVTPMRGGRRTLVMSTAICNHLKVLQNP